jgi:hypothetical protein
MQNSAKKYEEEEKIRKQMEYQVGENEDIMEDLSFEEEASRVRSHHPPEFYEYVFDVEYPKRLQPTRRASFLQTHPSRMDLEPPLPLPADATENAPEMATISQLLKKVSENRPPKQFDRESEPE